MTSNIKLYYIPGLSEENNFVLPNMYTYLQEFTSALRLEVSQFQYQRLEDNKTIKISAPQRTATDRRDYNYCMITASSHDTLRQYYFVVGYRQYGQETVELTLKLDTLNTFWGKIFTSFAEGTYIARAHRDRFSIAKIDGDDITLARIFDRVNEGDNPKLECDGAPIVILDQGGGDDEADPLRFYLVYKTAENGQPCIDFCATKQLPITAPHEGDPYQLLIDSMPVNGFYYLLGDISIILLAEQRTGASDWENVNITFSSGDVLFKFWRGNDGFIHFLWLTSDSVTFADPTFPRLLGEARVNRGVFIQKATQLYFSTINTNDQSLIRTFSYQIINAGTVAPTYIPPISFLDRTQSRNIKAIECPYCPITYARQTISGNYVYDFGNYFETKSPEGFLRTYDLSRGFPKRIISSKDFSDYAYEEASINDLRLTMEPMFDDSKIFTSPYFQPTFFYDSFAYAVKLEDYDRTEASLYDFAVDIYYKQSSAISSNLCFSFDDPALSGFNKIYSVENYDRLLAVSRQNELPLFSSEYLNYLRNGYNYDKKKLGEQSQFNVGMAAFQAIASAVSFALSGVTGGFSAVAGVGLAAGAATSFANIAHSTKQGQEELGQKINQLKAQSFSVSGIDDLDLFVSYGKNKLSYKLYHMTPQEEARMDQKFRYYGYAIDTYAIPSEDYTQSRRFYNFLKCDPVFIEPIRDLFGEYVDEVMDKLRAGVTIWHLDGLRALNFAFNRDVENIEMSIYNEIEE